MKGFNGLVDRVDKVAVFRALPGLGDMLCAVPALRALRTALPHGHITLVGLPQSGFMRERFSAYVDELVEFPGYPGLPERAPPIPRLPGFFRFMQRRRFDLLLQMHGSGNVTNPLVMLFNAASTAGFHVPGQYCPDEKLFMAYPDEEPEVRRHLRLMEHLGISTRGEALEFPLFEADRRALQAIPGAEGLQAGEYACLHPGASHTLRRWPPEHFAAIADHLAHRGLRIVLTGSAAEEALVGDVQQAMRHRAINLAGRTGLGSLAALLEGARLLVCNDTGVSHLAAALKTPSVVIFIATAPGRWAPLDRKRHRAVTRSSAETVLQEAEDLLNKEYSHAAC